IINPNLNSVNLSVYHNAKYNVNMTYPSEWTYEELGYSETYPERVLIALFHSPLEVQVGPNGVKSDMVQYSISIENLKPKSTTLEQYKDKIVKNLKDGESDVKDISITPTTLIGQSAYRIEDTTWLFDHWEKEVSTYVIKNGKIYEISWSGPQEPLD